MLFAKEVQRRGNFTVSTFSIMYFLYLQQALKQGTLVASGVIHLPFKSVSVDICVFQPISYHFAESLGTILDL